MNLNPSKTLGEKIAMLAPEVTEILRIELHNALRTLLDVGNVPGVLVSVSRLVEGERGLLGHIASACEHKFKGYNLEAQIEELRQKGIIPPEIASDFHWIRVRANRARHNIEKLALTVNDAETALNFALNGLEWFYCKCKLGPLLPAICSAEPAPPLTAHATVTQMLEVFLRSQQATEEQVRRQQAGLERLRAQQAADRLRRKLIRERIVGPVPSSVVQHFKDRTSELRSLREQLANENLRIVLVCGRGGMGKTSLITKLLHDVQLANFTLQLDTATMEVDSIVYVPLRQSEFRSPDKIVDLICRAMESEAATELRAKWQDKSSLSDKLEFLFHRILGSRRCLIVFDNFEDVLSEENQIRDEFADLLQFVERCLEYNHEARIVATSRRTLVLPPEIEGRVGTRWAELQLSNGLPENEAVELLRELDTDGRLGIKDAPDETLRHVALRCHGIPRTIETLVGTLRQRRTRTLSWLLNDEENYARLTDNPARELYESLSLEEQLVMQALAIYDRPVPYAAVQYLLPALPVDDILDTFVRNYVVTYDLDRFSLHPLDQQYAYRQIPDGEGDYTKPKLHTRAARFFRELRKPKEEWKTIDDLEPQLIEFYHLVHASLYDDACLLLNEIDFDYLLVWGYYALIVELRAQLIDRLTDTGLQVQNWCHLGLALARMGKTKTAIEHHEKALRITRENFDCREEGNNLVNLGWCYEDLGEIQKAIECYQQALAINRGIGYKQGEALSGLGFCYWHLGELKKAIDCHEQALAINREIGYKLGESRDFTRLALCWMDLGELKKAIKYHEQALEIDFEIGYKMGVAVDLGNLGCCYMDLGELAKGIEYCEQALEIDIEIAYKQGEAEDLEYIGRALCRLGKTQEAIDYFNHAANIAKEIDYPYGHSASRYGLGLCYKIEGNMEKSLEIAKIGLSSAREAQTIHYQSRCLLLLGSIYHGVGNLEEARRCYEEALALNYSITNYSCAVKLGILYLEEGNAEEARKYFQSGIAVCRTLLEKTPKFYDSLYHLALAQLGSGKHQEALATYRQALGVCSAKGVVQRALQDLRLLERAKQEVTGLDETIALLEGAIVDD